MNNLTDRQIVSRYALFDTDTSAQTADDEAYRMSMVQRYAAEITRRNLWTEANAEVRRINSLPALDR